MMELEEHIMKSRKAKYLVMWKSSTHCSLPVQKLSINGASGTARSVVISAYNI
jgi:hypothetical protein